VANGEWQDTASKPLLQRVRQGYWDRLLMDPGGPVANSGLSAALDARDIELAILKCLWNQPEASPGKCFQEIAKSTRTNSRVKDGKVQVETPGSAEPGATSTEMLG